MYRTLHRLPKLMFLLLVATALCARAPRVEADLISSYGIFADHLVFFSGGVNTFSGPAGPIGSNGDVYLSGGNIGDVRGGGSLLSFASSPKISGNVVFNDNVMLGTFSTVVGDIHAGGDTLLRTTVTGNVTAGGSVMSNSPVSGNITSGGASTISGTVGGNLSAAGSITLSAAVTGNATYGLGKSLNLLSGGSVGGTSGSGPVAANPQTFQSVALPAPHSFSSGGSNIFLDTFDDITLTPGSYGTLTIKGANDVNLSAGDYYFDAITMINSFVNFNFDASAGPINIFVTGSVLLHSPNMRLNGATVDNVNPALAGNVYWEVHDAFSVDFASVLGTVYTPFGDININSLSKATGALISGHDILSDGVTFRHGSLSPTLQVVPEPPSLILAAVAMLGLAVPAVRRRRVANA